MPDNPSPEMLKKMRAATPSPPPKVTNHRPTVEDAPDEDDDMNGSGSSNTVLERVRDFAPGGDADYFVEEGALRTRSTR